MAFKPIRSTTHRPESPEALFRDIREKRVEGLLSHQADIVREYVDRALEEPDVALELPTGSGKTLVGLVIGEWRRVTRQERIVFLCPTKQLVNQVVEQASRLFGIRVAGFTGSKNEYDVGSKGSYQNAETIAVTTYAALFNTRPFFDDPNLVILDDAHTSENYISQAWSLDLARTEYPALFDAVAGLIGPLLPEGDRARLGGDWKDSFDRTWADIIPAPRLQSVDSELSELLDTGVAGTNLVFPWQLLRDHIRACHLFVGTQQITIRPWVPPTETHQPFAGATQRIYMSATLGNSGDLQRITGRRHVVYLSTKTYAKHGVGRRLFLFPERSLPASEVKGVIQSAINEAGRALLITPSEAAADSARTEISQTLKCATFDARDIEESKAAFLSEEKAVAIVANRYDGIDLPRDECRLLILDSLPRAKNLMERFVIERMGGAALLTERITNRVVQAVGRCTRSDTDYAIVIPLGGELSARLLHAEQRRLFHPEMQAELEFGVQQSTDASISDYMSYITSFLAQDDDWSRANGDILRLRDQCERRAIPGSHDLASAVGHEVRYQYALWASDWEAATDAAREALGLLQHDELRGYRAYMSYLAGVAMWYLADSGQEAARQAARDYFRSAHRAVPGVRWLGELARQGQSAEARPAEDGAHTLIVRMERVLESLGMQNNHKFSREEIEIRTGLRSDSAAFESAHLRLGRLLGFEAGNVETPGAPDPWWLVDQDLCFVFEDHSDAHSDSALSVSKARQAASHVAWVRANLPLRDAAIVTPVLISPVQRADKDAVPHLHDVCHWPLEEFLEWAGNALTLIRSLRANFPGAGDLLWQAQAAEALRSHGLTPRALLQYLSSRPASRLAAG